MAYGTIKVDTITFTDGGIDKSVAISGLVQNPTFTGNVTATGTISGDIVRGQTISGVTVTGTTAQFTSGTFVSLTGTTLQGTTATYTTGSFTSLTGTTTSGTTANFVSGVFSTQISGVTVTGTTANFTSGNFTNISGGTHTITSGVFALGTEANPSISFVSDPNSGLFSPGADQVAISTSGTQRVNFGTGEVVFNETGEDYDFRIEGDTEPNLVFVDASTNRVGIGVTPVDKFQVSVASDTTALIYSSGAGIVNIAALSNAGNASKQLTLDGKPLVFGVESVERGRWDSSGRFLVGTSTTSKQTRALVQGNSGGGATAEVIMAADTSIPTGGVGNIYFSDNSHNTAAIIAGVRDGGTWTSGSSHPISLQFSTTSDGASSPTERMRIDSAGQLLFATTSTALSDEGFVLYPNGEVNMRRNTDGAAYAFNRSGSTVGSITISATATAYNTSSDYRLKENVVPLNGAIDRLNQLQVHRFNFIADPDKTVDGFIAHEAQAVVPECVTGTKDEVDNDGNPIYQGIDQSKLVPLLTAALQEALAEIESLKARLTAAGI